MSATPFGQFWPSTWSTDGTFNNVGMIAGTTAQSTTTIVNSGAAPNQVLDTEVGIDIAYGSSISGGGAIVYLCGDVNGTNFESPTNDSPFSFTMPAVASAHVRRRILVPGTDLSRFQVAVTNPSGNSNINVTVTYHQSQGQVGGP